MKPTQFTRKLVPYDGNYHNYFGYGGFERDLERGRLVQRFDYGQDKCTLLFEEHPQEETAAAPKPMREATASKGGTNEPPTCAPPPPPRPQGGAALSPAAFAAGMRLAHFVRSTTDHKGRGSGHSLQCEACNAVDLFAQATGQTASAVESGSAAESRNTHCLQ